MESVPRQKLVRNFGSATGAAGECRGFDSPGFGTDDEAANDSRMSRLVRTIEHEIIPRLMLAHRAPVESFAAGTDGEPAIGAVDVTQFAQLVLTGEEDRTFEAVEVWRARGVPVDKIYLDLLGPTARHLGDMWTEDLCTFTDVTIGLGRLQRVLRELSPSFGNAVEHPADGRRVLLLPSPGEQHTFGLIMVAEFFGQAGWDVTGGAWAADADAASLVSGEWFDVVGFSLGAEVHLDALKETIRVVRHATCNPNLAILVGGPMCGWAPDCCERVGADGMTADGREAPELAERLIVKTGKR